MSKKVELGYWRYRGLAHPLRFVLQYLGVPYTEKNYFLPEGGVTKETWAGGERAKIRATYPPGLPFPNVPYLVDGDLHVSESKAVMRYIARTYGPQLLGTTPLVQTRVDMLESYLYDFWYMEFAHRVYEDTPEAIAQFNAVHPEKLGLISRYVGDNTWAAGPELTVVDFWLCEFLEHLTIYDATIVDDDTTKLLAPFPNLQRLRDNFQQLPAIAAYRKSGDFIQTPCYSPRANLKL